MLRDSLRKTENRHFGVKICDNTSVGMVAWKDDKLLLIERAKPPYGFAPPAGHVDEFGSFEEAAKQELKEEVGLETERLELLFEGRKENKCRRPNGSWHYWKWYKVEVSGDITRNLDEAKQVGWYSKDEIKTFANRTKQYIAGGIPDEEWEKHPGLEVQFLDAAKQMGIVK